MSRHVSSITLRLQRGWVRPGSEAGLMAVRLLCLEHKGKDVAIAGNQINIPMSREYFQYSLCANAIPLNTSIWPIFAWDRR